MKKTALLTGAAAMAIGGAALAGDANFSGSVQLDYLAVPTDDFARGARVFYNRLEEGMPLQMDSTVHYISGRSGDVFTTPEERDSDSPYNTYKFPGLPPGPIGSPGEAAIEAALNPEAGDWVYFVADPDTGDTTFSVTYSEHQQACRDAGFSC